MTRVEPLQSSRAGLFARATYAIARRDYGVVPEPVAVTAHAPGLLAGYCALEVATDRAHRVPTGLKQLAELKAALIVGCEFCIDIGSFLSDRHGVPAEKVRAVAEHRDSDAFDDLERLVIDYAEAMTNTPVSVSDEMFAALREHFDDAQLVELTSVIALENYRARFNWALDIGAQGFSKGAACAMPSPATAAA